MADANTTGLNISGGGVVNVTVNCGCGDGSGNGGDNTTVEELNYYKSDTEAKAAGLSLGDEYLLGQDNIYAMAFGLRKTVSEP